ncbi:UvrD-helicase domain-containing protein [Intrasporangium sp.]|uniref:UvrD-helicase domain-containing protein n=1 Tax=Intrasporangium sp. TaxID=1925024 RepID=UPI00293AC2BE|nr:UvrD-helicase domain-containing protein [Intrasporangium sp.]MDV3220932.1 UvrD-helicase domain-containing protein [Intrasporangium sp.]
MRLHDALVDETARNRIRTDTDATLFVDAGAGSGKTSALVSRVQQLVVEDGIPIDEIGAVTFTERAAAELRARLRARLEAAAAHTTRDEVRTRAETALDGLDMAAIGTLHSFAQRILTEHPIEAGIPPLIEVLDEVASSVAFESRWAQLRSELLNAPEMSVTLEMALATGITLDHVRSLIATLNSDWDLVESHVLGSGTPEPPRLPDVAPLRAEARRLATFKDHCTDESDRFLEPLGRLADWADALDAASDTSSVLTALGTATELKWGGGGRAANWGGRLADLKAACTAWQADAKALLLVVKDATLRSIVHWCGERVLASARERQAEGRLEFHDLLVLARDLLRDDAEVRATLQERYRRLLLDEFQDTDPIQVEIAVRIAGGAAATQQRWEDVEVPDGSIFVVGDPKQSIYRFRRADIGMYLQAQQVLGETVSLTTNFRTGAPILDWVNEVFGRLIEPDGHRQPAYLPLDQHRPGPTMGPAVTVVGAEEHAGRVLAGELRTREARDVAQAVVRALDEGWTTEVTLEEKGASGIPLTEWRPLRPGDITILVPSRTSLPYLETALDEAQVNYRTESSSLVYQAQEVRDLFAAARAVADPSDSFAVVTALRSPLFGCGDDDLWTWKRSGGAFSVVAPPRDDAGSHPVGRALRYLRSLHHASRYLTPSEVLGRIAVDRRMFEVAVFGPRARDSWRRLRFVIDQARAWSEVEHGGLRAYLAWAAAQSAEGSRVAESVLPESDVDSVRIMTIHAAKGLEFPMVVLSGMTSRPHNGAGVRLLWKDGSYAVRLGKDVETGDFQEQVPLDEQMSDYERMRLLYVATTRARDHLVVSLHRCGNTQTNAKHLADAGAAEAAWAVRVPSDEPRRLTGDRVAAVAPPPDFEPWLAGLRAAVAASRRRPASSASGLEGTDPDAVGPAPGERSGDRLGVVPPLPEDAVGETADPAAAAGVAKGGRDLEHPAWSKGRYGSAVGRAVHGVLQRIDLATGAGVDEAVAAQCVAEGVVEFAPLVTDLVRSALASDAVKRAAVREHWRESYVGVIEEDGTVREGFVDLIYREDDGSLVIVDYKTDDVPDAALPFRVGYYAPQLRAYESMLRTVTDGAVQRAVLVFARPGPPAERELPRAST